MLDNIIKFSIKNKLVVPVYNDLVAHHLGSVERHKLPIDAVPDITNNQVQKLRFVPHWRDKEVEQLVTFPIEKVLPIFQI